MCTFITEHQVEIKENRGAHVTTGMDTSEVLISQYFKHSAISTQSVHLLLKAPF